MSPSSTTLAPRRKQISTEVRLDELLAEVETHEAVIKAAEKKKAASIKAAIEEAEDLYAEEVGASPRELAALLEELTSFLVQRRYTLTSRLKQTIERPMGVVKYIKQRAEMDWPKVEEPVVKHLEARADGLKWLVVTTKLDKRALLHAPPELLAELRPYGVWKGKHLHISLKTPSMGDPVTLVKRRFNERPLRKQSSK